jgi:hypothetical protein
MVKTESIKVFKGRRSEVKEFPCIVGGGVQTGMSATYWPIVPAPGDCEDGEFGGMNGRGNRSTRRKPALTPLCPPQIPHDQTRD